MLRHPLIQRVVEAMLPYFYEIPVMQQAETILMVWQAGRSCGLCREQIAQLIQVDPKEIIFTSGATESDNLAIKGVFEMYSSKGNHIITTKVEHKQS